LNSFLDKYFVNKKKRKEIPKQIYHIVKKRDTGKMIFSGDAGIRRYKIIKNPKRTVAQIEKNTPRMYEKRYKRELFDFIIFPVRFHL